MCSRLLPTIVNGLLESVYLVEFGCLRSVQPERSYRRSCKVFVMTGSSVSWKWRPYCTKLTIAPQIRSRYCRDVCPIGVRCVKGVPCCVDSGELRRTSSSQV